MEAGQWRDRWAGLGGLAGWLGWVAWLGCLAGLLDASASKFHPPLFLPPLPLPLPLPPPLLQTHKRPTNRDSRLHSLCGSSRLVAPTSLSGQRRSVCAYAGLDPSQASRGLALYCLLALLILPLALNFASGIACRAPTLLPLAALPTLPTQRCHSPAFGTRDGPRAPAAVHALA